MRERTMEALRGNSEKIGEFLMDMVQSQLDAYDNRKEFESRVIADIIDLFFDAEVFGREILKLIAYTKGDPKFAYVVLNNDVELEVFRDVDKKK